MMCAADSEEWKKEFVHLLERATIGNDLAGKAFELKSAHLPSRIYKYRKDSEHSRNNLENSTLWLCSPDGYNDPFDCRAKISYGSVESALARALVRGFFKDVLNFSNLGLTVPKIERRIAESIESYVARLIETYSSEVPASGQNVLDFAKNRLVHHLPDFTEEARTKSAAFRSLTKACSFSECNNSILMWSHYAENHQGFCVEYDLSTISETHPLRGTLFPIIYSKQMYDSTPLVVDWIEKPRERFNPFFPLPSFLHKAEEWKYEREWRLLFFTPNAEPDHPWPAPVPSRIFLGARMSDFAKERIRTTIAGKPIEIHEVTMADGSFILNSKRTS